MNELLGKYEGTVLICGSASTLQADYAEAFRARPNASVIAINDAASEIFADFLATLHPEDAARFKAASKNPDIKVISGQLRNDAHPVDQWFEDCNSGATSAGGAIKMAIAMGFEEIVLCGCPMSGGDGYFNAPPKKNKSLMAVRFGNAAPGSSVVQAHQRAMVMEARAGDYHMVRSMSGWTAEHFGLPDFRQRRYA